MSHLPPGQVGFLEQVQFFFTELSGRTFLLGPRDLAYLQELQEAGVAARAVCRGIDEAFRAYGERDKPRSVRQCGPFIEAEARALGERSLGTHARTDAYESPGAATPRDTAPAPSEAPEASVAEAPATPELLREALAAIEAAGRQADEERWREAYRQGWRAARRLLDEQGAFGFEELEATDVALIEAYLDALGEQERLELEDAIALQTSNALDAMSPRARREHLWARRRQELLRRHGLVDLLRILSR
ncbi:hypothetical protein DL240_09655 [Lujinxingia litoralis]|uniref:Uncharacterized protein n=1 Tax=Lujinxingia litoralis TaxID=2211119 RepID=A0A328C6V0_9DELT|nr:hypothetical protein [Lujinxingia litoralis]RAL22110.1 hypothetical protein DL240_09655 [Lujinxingia litoralis]